ncbi:hypothetical protein QQF64_035194 [Cirrhinus molitorella]|uniref:Uncharacterized protein n=1 Tax=Cirrhinus molitorella TaxID=172907 RepID=A0ABR3NFR6_9TELE
MQMLTTNQDTIYINDKAKVVFSDLESSNRIFHEPATATPHNFSDVVSLHDLKTFYMLLEDKQDVGDGPNSSVCYPVPAHRCCNFRPGPRAERLYTMHNCDQLAEYLRYHIMRDTKPEQKCVGFADV